MKFSKLIIINIILFFMFSMCYGQHNLNHFKENIFYLGLGTGLDYGGLGIKGEVLPIPYLGIFAGLGYNFESLGANAGLSFKALPNKRATPTIQAMYGYNSVIVVRGASEYNKTYYGPSVGAGLDWEIGRNANKLFFAVYYPFRSEKFEEDLDKLKKDPAINFENEPLPVAFSLGFNFGF